MNNISVNNKNIIENSFNLQYCSKTDLMGKINIMKVDEN